MPDSEFQYQLTLSSDADTKGFEDAAKAQEDLNKKIEQGGTSGQRLSAGQRQIIENNQDLVTSANDAAEAIEDEAINVEDSAAARDKAVTAVKEHIKVIDQSVEALEDEAKAAQRANEQFEQIRALQQAQLLGEFARGLGDVAKIARDSGMEEFADDLDTATRAAQVATTIVQGGLGLSQLITQLGGMRTALSSAVGFLTGPAGIALAASAAAFAALQFAVKKASDEMDAIARQAAQPSLFGEEGARRSKQAVEDLTAAIAAQIDKRDELLDTHDKELAALKLITAEKLAQINADEAVALARVNADEANDVITPDTATKRRANISESADQARLSIGSEQRTAEVNTANEKAAAAAETVIVLEEKLAQLNAQNEELLINLDEQGQEQLRQLNERAKGLIKVIALAESADVTSSLRNGLGLPSSNPIQNSAEAELSQVNAARDRLIKDATNENKVEVSASDLAELRNQVAEAKKESQEAREEAEQIKLENASRQTRAETAQRATSTVRGITARSTLNQRETAREEAREKAANSSANGSNVSSADSEFNNLASRAVKLADDVNAPNQQKEVLQSIVAKLEDGASRSEAAEFTRFLATLSNFITIQERDKRGNATRVSRLENQLKKLSSQVSNNRDS